MGRFYEIYEFQLFSGCNRELVDDFLRHSPGKITAYAQGDIIALQGDRCRSLLLLCEGSLSARMTNDEGKEIIVEVLHAPDVLAPAFLYGSENRFPVTLQAEEAVHVWSLSQEDFLKMMETDKHVLRNFLQYISDRCLFLSRKLGEFALQNLSDRVVGYLKRYGFIQNIQEVASKMGVARPSLSRTIAALVGKGTVVKEGNRYVLKSDQS